MKHAKTYVILYQMKWKTFTLLFFLSFVTFSKTRLLPGAFLENGSQDMCKSFTPLFLLIFGAWICMAAVYFYTRLWLIIFQRKLKQAIWRVHLSLLISRISWVWCQNGWMNFSPLRMQPNNLAALLSGLLIYESSRKSVKFTSFDADQIFT